MTAALFCLLAFAQVSAAGQTTPIAVQVSAAPPKIGESLRPIPFWQVKLEDDFWAPRIRTTIEKTIPACFDQCEKTGRIANWDKAAKKEGKFEGYFFNDSDVYKVIEAAAYALKLDPNATYKGRKLDEYIDELIAKIAAMQQPDGYVNSYFVLTGEPKWTDIEHKHELYCAGHLIEAAVAHYLCTGKRNLLDVAIKLADHICDRFGREPGKNANPCGHPEIELAMIRLGHLPTDVLTLWNYEAPPASISDLRRMPHYPLLAMNFVDQHGRTDGRKKLWGEYAQDHKPLKDQTEIVGHAVRAMYLLSAATDLQRLNPDAGYLPALDSLWRDLTERKMYITGGIGNSAQNEGFTTAYDLPNETAYAETCASIGLVFWAHRMNLLHADGRYFDVLERALYNNVLAAISLDGTQFNYVNPLASRGQHRRQPWHACACCPPNLARLFPTIGGYMYAQDEKSIYVNLYAQSTATFQHGDSKVTIRQETKYPWDGKVALKIAVDRPTTFDLCLRVPSWGACGKLTVSDQQVEHPETSAGYVRVARNWKDETNVSIELCIGARRVYCDSRVKANNGRVALQFGPLVYCLESEDNKLAELLGGGVRNRVIPPTTAFEIELRPNAIGDVASIRGVSPTGSNADDVSLYRSNDLIASSTFRAIPYYAWNNRDAGDMIVWIPESPAFLDPQPVAWLKPSASHCWSRDTVAALHDRLEPANSSDAGIPRFTWWPKKGGEQKSNSAQTSGDDKSAGDEQWVQYDFDKPRTVSAVEVYWFDDSKQGGGCRPPAEWRLQSRVGDEWLNVSRELVYGVETDRFNRVSFKPHETTGLRIVAKLADGFSAGILEWKVESP